MRFFRKILGAVLLGAGIMVVRGRRKAQSLARGLGADPQTAQDNAIGTSVPSDDMYAVATQSGIADVDPEPLSHVAGEGIDPIRDVEAHNSIIEQRERLPRH